MELDIHPVGPTRMTTRRETPMHYLLKPWRIAFLALGIALLYVGMYVTPAPDWTHGTIWAMGLSTYLLAPWAVNVFERRQYRLWPAALLAAYFCVDGVWWLTLKLEGNQFAIDTMREGNWPASLCLFLLVGIICRPSIAEQRALHGATTVSVSA